jgi:diadenylate cyclase
VKGVALILAVFVLSDWLRLNTLHYIISGAIQIGAFAVIVIFQPELRNLLEHIGRMRFGNLIDFGIDNERNTTEMMIESVVKAAVDLSETHTGALIVIERETALADYIRSGTKIDASVSSRLLENIFVPNTPLHDGAVIISKDRAAAASCLLPLTTNNNISPDLGTRHRAAIGLSECSDAVVIVVSEETGKISIALNGSLTRNLSAQTLTNALNKTVLQPKLEKATTTDKFDKFRFWRSK